MRCAIVASFAVLDIDDSGTLSPDELLSFASVSIPIRFKARKFSLHPEAYVECMEQIIPYEIEDDDDSIRAISAIPVLGTCRRMYLHVKRTSKKQPKKKGGRGKDGAAKAGSDSEGRSKPWQVSLRNFFQSKGYQHLLLYLLFLHLWACMAQSALTNDNRDVLLLAITGVYVLEMALRVLAYGWHFYWNQPNHAFKQLRNRHDFYLLAATLLMLAAAFLLRVQKVSSGEAASLWPLFQPWARRQRSQSLRFVLMFPLMRMFSAVKSLEGMYFGLIYIAPVVVDAGALLVAVSYVYAVALCQSLADQFKYIETGLLTYGQQTFNGFLSSVTSLFEMFSGDWTPHMYSALDASGVVWLFVFVSYGILVGLLISNLVVGVVFAGYGRVTDMQKKYATGGAGLSVRELRSVLVDGEKGGDKFVSVRLPDQESEFFTLSRPKDYYD